MTCDLPSPLHFRDQLVCVDLVQRVLLPPHTLVQLLLAGVVQSGFEMDQLLLETDYIVTDLSQERMLKFDAIIVRKHE